jgi:hypothetical protein
MCQGRRPIKWAMIVKPKRSGQTALILMVAQGDYNRIVQGSERWKLRIRHASYWLDGGGLYLRATSTGVTNSLRMNPVGPLLKDRTSSQSPCLLSTETFVPVVNVTREVEVKFGY